MKKVCYGLLLAFSIMLGLSLNGCSDANALKYAYNAFPVYTPYVNGVQNGVPFSISFVSSSSMTLDESLTNILRSGFWKCLNRDNEILGNRDTIWSRAFDSQLSRYSVSGKSSFRRELFAGLCSSNDDAIDWSYDSLYTADYNVSTGEPLKLVDLSNAFFDQGQDGFDSGTIQQISIPLGLNPSLFRKIDSGTLLEWDVGLVNPAYYFNDAYHDVSLDSSFDIVMHLQYFTLDPDTSSQSDFRNSHKSSLSYPSTISVLPTCTLNDHFSTPVFDGDVRETFVGLNIHCSYTTPEDVYYLSPLLRLSASDNDGFLTYDYEGLYLSSSYLTTDGDETWSGLMANASPTGTNLDDAPGYHQLYGYLSSDNCADGDFLCELSNLFSFSVLNPFAPLFNLFTDNSSCANIPIIASMLNSEETTYCPWFSSDTRNILTPVLGLAAAMLVFGFFVRWLGSSSGNMFEDSGSIESPGTSRVGDSVKNHGWRRRK